MHRKGRGTEWKAIMIASQTSAQLEGIPSPHMARLISKHIHAHSTGLGISVRLSRSLHEARHRASSEAASIIELSHLPQQISCARADGVTHTKNPVLNLLLLPSTIITMALLRRSWKLSSRHESVFGGRPPTRWTSNCSPSLSVSEPRGWSATDPIEVRSGSPSSRASQCVHERTGRTGRTG